MIGDPVRAQIQALGLWRGEVRIETLHGGITNRNFVASDGQAACAVRFGDDLPDLGVYRRNELVCHRAAEILGVAPAVVLAQDGILVTRFIEGRTLSPEGVREGGFASRLAAILRKLHDGWDSLSGDMLAFSPFQACRTYVETSRRLGATLPPDIDAIMEDFKVVHRRLGPFIPTLCHNDMLPANVLDDGSRVWIVDWEYAGIGHPLFDLAGVSANCGLDREADMAFLAAYRGEFRPQDLFDLNILKAASLLREALWSVVQTVASDLDFDYRGYADVHFEKYRLARHGLDGGSGRAVAM